MGNHASGAADPRGVKHGGVDVLADVAAAGIRALARLALEVHEVLDALLRPAGDDVEAFAVYELDTAAAVELEGSGFAGGWSRLSLYPRTSV